MLNFVSIWLCTMYVYHIAESLRVPYGPLALDHLSMCQMISFLSRNNQQSHMINILLASFARSVWKVMDLRFFPFLVFIGPALFASEGKISFNNLPYGPRLRLIRSIYVK